MILASRFALVIAIALAGSGAATAQARFLATFEDVPLAPGLEEQAGRAFTFAGPGGAIEETVAAGAADEGAVRSFYRLGLEALGWSLEDDGGRRLAFARGRERLTLTFTPGSDGRLSVRYRMVARGASLALD